MAMRKVDLRQRALMGKSLPLNLQLIFRSLILEKNYGKGEAVRRGLMQGLSKSYAYLGFADADLATPVTELARLYDVARAKDIAIVLGSRWLRIGARIERSGARHYLGRVFATFASQLLDLPIYDTQCGAKFFKKGRRAGRLKGSGRAPHPPRQAGPPYIWITHLFRVFLFHSTRSNQIPNQSRSQKQ